MYLRYFGFSDHPFALTPDPGFLFLSPHHREGLGHLVYGTGEHGGFVQLTGEVGTGKTTLIRALLEQDNSGVDVALCLNPRLTAIELVASICDELAVTYPAEGSPSLKLLLDSLNAHLLDSHAAGKRTVLIIDEAQDLSPETLEQLRLLTNLETRKHKLLRIILVGQPELEVLLARPDLRQLAQRITARYQLRSFHPDETRAYVQHRLTVAGGQANLFTPAALRTVHKLSAGIPRLVNIICERALLGAYSMGTAQIDPAIVKRAAAETQPRSPLPSGVGRPSAMVLVVLLGLSLLLLAAVGAAHRWLPDGFLQARLSQVFATTPEESELTEAEKAAAELSVPAQSDAGNQNAALPAATPAPDNATPEREEEVAAPGSEQVSPEVAESGVAVSTPDPGIDLATEAVKPVADAVVVPDLPEGNAEMAQLLRMWGVFGATVNARCEGMKIGDLRCLRDKGSFADLERFDRPVLIELQQGQRRRRVLLSELRVDAARIIAPGGVVEWPREALARVWTGDYQIVWRLESPVRRIQQGSVGSAVVWLRRQLIRAEGRDPDKTIGSPSPVFDEALANSLRRFQVSNGLRPDGIVGARTMILLNGVEYGPNDSSPRLLPTLEQD